MKYLLFIFSLFVTASSMGQLTNFSQGMSTPLSVNPANTGLLQGDFRVAASYNNEWNGVTVPYVTTLFSYDMSLLKGKLEGSSLGIGFTRVDRRAGDENEVERRTGISVAYHKLLNKNKERPSQISIGVQGDLVQKEGELSQLFTSHIPVPPGTFGAYKIGAYVDYSLGALYTGYVNERLAIYGGVSYFHLLQPVESYLKREYIIRAKLSTQLGGSYKLSERLNFNFNTLIAFQGKAYDVTLGGIAAYNFSPNQLNERKQFKAYFGTWYIYNDALVPYAGLGYNGFRLGVSSDLNLNTLTEASMGSVFELSLLYNGTFSSGRPFDSNLFSPLF